MRCIRVKAGLAPSGPWGFRLKKQGFNSGSSQRLRDSETQRGGGQAQGGVLSRRAMGFAGFREAHGRGAMNSAALSL